MNTQLRTFGSRAVADAYDLLAALERAATSGPS